MARMVIRQEDRISDDPRKHAQLSKRGDCIVIVDDAHEFSSDEHAIYAIVEVPGASLDDLSAFYIPDVQDHRKYRLLRRKAFKFDLDRWHRGPLLLAEALALKVRHEPLFDPDVIGMTAQ